jgi:hypothetical protein
MRKLITLTLAVLLVGLFAAVVFAAVEAGDDSSSSTVGTTETTETTDTTETTTTPGRAEDRRAPQPGVDISGPCDEAEHANDPRCTGVQPGAAPGGAVVDDHRGRGRGRGRGGDDGFDDHGGNSGPGGGGDDDSGHGGDDDSSGHGSGDDD